MSKCILANVAIVASSILTIFLAGCGELRGRGARLGMGEKKPDGSYQALAVVYADAPRISEDKMIPESIQIYKTVDECQLKIHFDFPSGWQASDKRPIILFFRGGPWHGDSVGRLSRKGRTQSLP